MKPSDCNFGRAPGKVILSGEHSVVYGAPALVVTIEAYTEVWFEPIHLSHGLHTAFDSLSQGQLYPLDILKTFKQRLDSRFDSFLRGDLAVQNILQRPDDLAIYTMSALLQMLPVPGGQTNQRLPVPGRLHSTSSLPLGAGMGSSAAIIAATIVLYEHLLKRPQTLLNRFEQVRFCERLQHGKGSAVDAAAVTYGGMNRVQNGAVSVLSRANMTQLRQGKGWYRVLSGSPVSSTGESVSAVRQMFGADQALWQSFEDCTDELQMVLKGRQSPLPALRENHRLLSRLRVVPATATHFIDAIEASGGAAKICGAGAVRGEKAGVILVYQPDIEAFQSVIADYPRFSWDWLKIADLGAALCGPGIGSALPAPNPNDPELSETEYMVSGGGARSQSDP
jgi:mevalonate kinase